MRITTRKNVTRVWLVVFQLFYLVPINAQVQWPVITKTTKPWTRWWWEGSAVDQKNLTAAMEQYKSAGLGGMELTPIYGVKGEEALFINFLSPKWMQMLTYTLSEANRLGLGIDMANATGWPFGGSWVKPADAAKNVNSKTYFLKKGESLQEPVQFEQKAFYRTVGKAKVDWDQLTYPVATNKNLQAYAFDQIRYPMLLKPAVLMAYGDNGDIKDLTSLIDAQGKLQWTATDTNWKLVALFQGFHGKMVERAAPGGEGDVIDHFSSIALKHYLQHFDSAFAGNNISGIRSFFNDSYEVDDARGQSNWTPDFLREFETRRGYDLRKYLPQLFGRDSTDNGRRVLTDYRQTISDLVLDHFTKPWQQWARNKNKMVRNQSHGSPANILDLYAAVDIPETEGEDILRFKFASSAAHVTGKQLVSSETATWLNEHFQSTWADVKQAVDKYFVGGVNHVFWHGTSYSPQQAAWPGWLFYAAVHFTPANPLWKDFGTLNEYVARCQSFLQKGKSDNDVLVYYPFNDRIAAMSRDLLIHFDGMNGFDGSIFKDNAEWLLKKGYGYDFISDRQLQSVVSANDQLQTGGSDYRTILLSGVEFVPLETFQKLYSLARKGATIVFLKQLPKDVPGMSDLTERQAAFKKLLEKARFRNIYGKNVLRARIGNGYFLLGEDLSALMTEAKAMRETMTDMGLQYTRRKYADGHVYFISNPTGTALNGWVNIGVKEKNMQVFDPMTRRAGQAKARINNGQVQVFLQLAPGDSRMIQTFIEARTAPLFPYDTLSGKPIAIEGNWDLAFVSGGPVLPGNKTMEQLHSWTELAGEDVKNFSGTVRYSIHFPKPVPAASRYQLDLGKVAASAVVFLNGKKIATLIGPRFIINIPANAFRNGDNLLEIDVTNTMANRIAYMDKTGIPWKKFYNINFPAKLAADRDGDGLFTAAKWLPQESGLLGPVTLQALK
jgi:hypothetical protein